MIKVYLDDKRPCPDGWVLVKTVHDAVELTETGIVEEISLDNDLGDGVWEGWRFAAWLETKAAADPFFKLPKVRAHTSNPVAKKRIMDILEAIHRNFPRA